MDVSGSSAQSMTLAEPRRGPSISPSRLAVEGGVLGAGVGFTVGLLRHGTLRVEPHPGAFKAALPMTVIGMLAGAAGTAVLTSRLSDSARDSLRSDVWSAALPAAALGTLVGIGSAVAQRRHGALVMAQEVLGFALPITLLGAGVGAIGGVMSLDR